MRIVILVDIECNTLKENSLEHPFRNATFNQPETYIEDFNYTSGRKLNREIITRMVSYEYIAELFITVFTCSRKTYMAYTFSIEATIRPE